MSQVQREWLTVRPMGLSFTGHCVTITSCTAFCLVSLFRSAGHSVNLKDRKLQNLDRFCYTVGQLRLKTTCQRGCMNISCYCLTVWQNCLRKHISLNFTNIITTAANKVPCYCASTEKTICSTVIRSRANPHASLPHCKWRLRHSFQTFFVYLYPCCTVNGISYGQFRLLLLQHHHDLVSGLTHWWYRLLSGELQIRYLGDHPQYPHVNFTQVHCLKKCKLL